MLTKLREKSQGFMILVLFGMLIIVFVFFFGPQADAFRPGGVDRMLATGDAAKVNGQEISMREVEMVVRRSVDASDIEEKDLARVRREGVLQLVDQVLLEQRARQMGLAVGEEELSKYIVTADNPDYPAFLNHQKQFDYQAYEAQVTQGFGVSLNVYRAFKERELLVERYLDFLQSQIKVPETEVRQAFDRARHSWNLEYVRVDAASFPPATPPAPEEGAAWAKDHAADVQAWYDAHKDDYDREKEVRVRRILVRVAKGADEATQKAAREKIDGLLTKVKAEGADFAAIATADSEDYYKTYGGDMGWQSPKNTSAADYEIYSKLEKGQLSDVQSSTIGLWFVKAEDVKPAVKKTLDEVRDEIGLILVGQAAAKKGARAAAEALLAQVKGGTALADAAAATLPKPAAPPTEAAPVVEEGAAPVEPPPAAESPVEATGPFTANRPAWDEIPGIGKAPAIARRLEALTTEAPLVDEVIELEDAFVVARLRERKKPTDEEFKAEQDQFVQQLKAGRAAQLFGNWKAVVFGPVSQRELFLKFAGGALLTSLPKVDGSAVALNTEKFPEPPAATPASIAP